MAIYCVRLVGVLLYILTVTLYRIAFRADSAGITFGANLMSFKFYAAHIPWPDIETIILYTLRERPSLPAGSGGGKVDYLESTNFIGIKRRAGAPALAQQPFIQLPGSDRTGRGNSADRWLAAGSRPSRCRHRCGCTGRPPRR